MYKGRRFPQSGLRRIHLQQKPRGATMDKTAPATPALEMAEAVLRQGELYLQAQLQSAIASDQRATTMAAFFSSMGAAIAAASLAYWDRSGEIAILVAGLSGGILMAAGACLCLWAARPVDFYFPGNHPSCYGEVMHKPLADVICGEAENYQEHIEKNATILQSNSKLVSSGAMASTAAPLIAILIWGIVSAIAPSSPAATASDDSRLQSSEDAPSQTSQ
jgi:hypothetical protein